MRRLFKCMYTFFDKISKCSAEEDKMVEFVGKMELNSNSKILDVGCGYGRNMQLFTKNKDFIASIEGIDVNEHIIEINRNNGLNCFTVDEFKNMDAPQYDGMIFSHIVEHFSPSELKPFLEYYLSFLKQDGFIIIATPLMHDGFYWDFDHIKPYHPVGFNMVFCSDSSQVQYYSAVKLSLVDVWFRRESYQIQNRQEMFIPSKMTNIWLLFNLIYKLIFKISFGILGKTNGWMALYKKM